MLRITLLVFLFVITRINFVQAQDRQSNKTIIEVSAGPVISLDWSFYHWYQRPNNDAFSIASNGNRSIGQVFNVLPSLRAGLLLGFDVSYVQNGLRWDDGFFLLLEGGVNFMPFSFDLEERKGQAALSFPVLLSAMIPIAARGGAITIGAGAQFSQIEFLNTIPKYKDLPNPFFVTYVVELGLGANTLVDDPGYGLLIGYNFFIRGGLNENLAVTVDTGVRLQLGYAR